MKKKILVMALGLIMAANLAACGGSSGTSDSAKTEAAAPAANGEVQDVTLKVWVPEEEREILDPMMESFEAAHPEYNMTWDVSITGIDEATFNLDTDADTAADVFQISSGGVPAEAQKGLLLPIGYQIDSVKELYSEGAIESVSVTGDDGNKLVYAIPFSPNSFFMYYNKDMYTEDEVKSLETMMAKDLGDDVYNFSCSVHNSWYIESFFYAAGCTLFGEDGTDPTSMDWNNENGLAAGKYLIDLVNNPKYIEDQDGIAMSLMGDGKLAALCSGTWLAPDVIEALGEDYGACALPTININGADSQLRNFGDYKCYAVKSNTQYPLAAQQFAEWLANEENQKARFEINNETPTVLSLADDPVLAESPAAVALMKQSEYYVPQPSISQMDEYWTPAEALGTGIVHGEITEANLQAQLDSLVESVTTKLVD